MSGELFRAAAKQSVARLKSALDSPTIRLLIIGLLSYQLVRDGALAWWLPIVIVLAAVITGALLGWHTGRRIRKR